MSEVKYEAVFGDQGLFEGADPDVFIVETNGVYKTFHKQTTGKISIWTRNGCDLAMRRIIKVPTWTKADQLAGKLPEVGCKAVQIQGFCEVDVLMIHNGCVVVCNSEISDSRPVVFKIDSFMELFTPLETPEAKAQRLRSEWVKHALDLYMSSPKNDVASMGDVYDAMLSGELKAPGVE